MVNDRKKTKAQLISELEELRKRVIKLESSESKDLHTESALSDSGLPAGELLKTLLASIYLIDLSGKILALNSTGAKRLSATKKELIGKNIWDFFPAEVVSKRKKLLKDLVKHKKTIRIQDERAGVYFDSSLRPIFDEDGQVIKVLIFAQDITWSKQVAEELRKKNFIIRSASSIIATTNLNGNISYVNSAFLKAWGFDSPDEVIGRPLSEFWMVGEKIDEIMTSLMGKEKKWSGEVQAKRKDGSFFHVLVSAATVLDDDGRPIALMSTSVDITERKQAEELLSKSEDKYRSLVETLREDYFLYTHGTDGVFTYVSPSITDMLGYSQEVFLTHYSDYFTDNPINEDAHRFTALAIEGKKQAPYLVEIFHKDGSHRWLRITETPLFTEDGKVEAIEGIAQDITLRKQAEESLKDSEANFRLLSEATFEAIVIHDGGVLHHANEQFWKMNGYEPGELLGKQMIPLLVAPESIDKIKNMIASGNFGPYEITGIRKNGDRYPMELRVRMMEFKGRQMRVAAIRDLSERKKIEDDLRAREAHYRLLFNSVNDAIFVHHIDPESGTGNFIEANEIACQKLGYTREELLTRTPGDITSSEQIADGQNIIEQLFKQKHAFFEKTLITKDGHHIAAEINSHLFELDGKPTILGLVRDITERRRTEEALRYERDYTAEIIKKSPALICGLSPEGNITFLNPAGEKITGFTIEELKGKNWWSTFYPGDDYEQVEKLFRDMGDKEIRDYEMTLTAKNGLKRIISWNSYKRFDSNGNLLEILGFGDDVTESILSERALKLSEEKYRRLVEISPYGIEETDCTGKIIFASPSLERMHGYSRNEMVGMSVSDLLPQPRRDEYLTYLELLVLKQPEPTVYYAKNLTKDGRIIDVEVAWEYKRNEAGEVIGFVSIVTDITLQKKAQAEAEIQRQQLLQADKLVTLGTLVAGVAHEINNPNSFIMLNAPILMDIWNGLLPVLEEHRKAKGDFTVCNHATFDKISPRIPALLNAIHEGAERIKIIVNDLKDYAREDDHAKEEPVDINDAVNSAINLTKNKVKNATHKFSFSPDIGLPQVPGNRQALEQVLLNLILNACDALQKKEQGINLETFFDRDEEIVRIRVEDEGMGIPEEQVPRISDPFFITKKTSGGTGLGLSISSRIIHDHGGTLEFKSVQGQGTTATISLPTFEGGRTDAE
ncbi:PAS domain S-box protein [Candidatus Riflebacteria bacterium]